MALPPEMLNLVLLALILVLAHAVETTIGFGDTMISLGLGLFLFPLQALLPALVVLAILQSTWMVIRWHGDIRWRLLVLTMLPLAALGMVLGILVRGLANERLLLLLLGIFIMAVAVVELAGLYVRRRAAGPLPGWLAVPIVIAGGIFQGLFATGGPPIVYFAGREMHEPAQFLSTISVLWLVLNAVLFSTMWAAGQAGTQSLLMAATVLPGFIAGVAIGSLVKVEALTFKVLTWAVLFVVGLIQLVRVLAGS